ncbi:MAG TPA: hypothetical protein H9804_10015 [Candidatus Mucispirillum faecigallinarum]|uniref:Transmembrane protein n=1 Tax=Candidatus Mucispirillum faecigallinarum TaxID=2838699 RepID=A0A9D2GVR2_9BACT|nr:hypothetical protein [Candidatus Mucispirillum faecigallinarum]
MKRIIIIISIIILMILSLSININDTYSDIFFNKKPYTELTKEKKIKDVINIQQNMRLSGIAFQIGTYNRINTCINNFTIYLNSKKIMTYDLLSDDIKDNDFHIIPLEIEVKKGDILEIEWASNGSKGNAVSPYIADKTSNSRLYIYNYKKNIYEETDKTLVYRLLQKVSIADYFTRIKQTPPINIEKEQDVIQKLNTWVAINDKIIIQKIDTKDIYRIDTLSFKIGTFARINNNTTNIYITDKDNNTLYQTKVMSNILKDNLLYTIENIGLKIKEGNELYLKIESIDDDEKNFIALYTIPPNIEAPMKLIDENNKSEETRQDSLFYAINGNISVEVFANIKYKEILQGNTYKVIEDNKSIRNSKILFYIIWFGLVTSFVLLISAIIEYIIGLNKKRKENETNNSDTMLQ